MSSLIGLILLVTYGGGAWKFWSGFNQTNFSRGFVNKARLSLLWPFLLASSKSYRQNFRKALKG